MHDKGLVCRYPLLFEFEVWHKLIKTKAPILNTHPFFPQNVFSLLHFFVLDLTVFISPTKIIKECNKKFDVYQNISKIISIEEFDLSFNNLT